MRPTHSSRSRSRRSRGNGTALRLADVDGGRWAFRLDQEEGVYLTLDDQQGSATLRDMSKRPDAFVIYLRVSTDEQGRSGLGLDAQRTACEEFVRAAGGRLVEVVEEVASGGDDDRPGLHRALQLAARANATLLVAKLDRLGRSVALVAQTLRSSTQLKVAEHPDASVLELHLRAVVGEEERRLIRERTRAALAEAKRKGKALGSARPGHWDGREDRRLAGSITGAARAAEARRKRAAGLLAQARPIVEAHADASLRALAAALEAAGVLTATGCTTWTPTGVQRLRAALAIS